MNTLILIYLMIGLGVLMGLSTMQVDEILAQPRWKQITACVLTFLFWPFALYSNYSRKK